MPGVRVVNRTSHPTAEVRAIVSDLMRGNPRNPPTVIVHPRLSPTDNREGWTPDDRSLPIELWIEPSSRYPEPGARTWQQELALSAAHEDYHFQHPGQACPRGVCDRLAEAYAHQHLRTLERQSSRYGRARLSRQILAAVK